MKERYLVLISKIIFFYSLFYVVMKLVAAFRGFMVSANLILALPYIVFAILGGWMLKNNRYYWAYVIAGVIVISAVRYFEQDWMIALENYFAN